MHWLWAVIVKTITNQGPGVGRVVCVASFSKHLSANRLKIDHEREIVNCNLCPDRLIGHQVFKYQNKTVKEDLQDLHHFDNSDQAASNCEQMH